MASQSTLLKHLLPGGLLFPFVLALLLYLSVEVLLGFTPLGDLPDQRINGLYLRKWEQVATDNPRQMDVLVLGTSRTLNGFATTEFEQQTGLNAYNFGLSGAQTTLYQMILQRYVQRYGKPKLVVLELSELQLSESGISPELGHEYHALLWRNPGQFWNEVIESPAFSDSEKQYLLLASLSSLYRYADTLSPRPLVHWLKESFRPHQSPGQGAEKRDERYWQGWMPSDSAPMPAQSEKQLTVAGQDRLLKVTSIATDLSTRHEESLLGWLKSRQIPVVLVRWPVHPVYARVIRKDAKYCRFEPALTQLARRYQVRLVDFQQVEPKPQPTDFFNLDHMTRQAGERYTQRLAETISK